MVFWCLEILYIFFVFKDRNNIFYTAAGGTVISARLSWDWFQYKLRFASQIWQILAFRRPEVAYPPLLKSPDGQKTEGWQSRWKLRYIGYTYLEDIRFVHTHSTYHVWRQQECTEYCTFWPTKICNRSWILEKKVYFQVDADDLREVENLSSVCLWLNAIFGQALPQIHIPQTQVSQSWHALERKWRSVTGKSSPTLQALHKISAIHVYINMKVWRYTYICRPGL